MTRTSDTSQRVLFVEEKSRSGVSPRMSLGAEGFEVVEAEGLQRGLIEAGTRRPHLVALDLGLPGGDGVELIRDLRSWSDVPVVVLSARATESDKIGALDAGAVASILSKPLRA